MENLHDHILSVLAYFDVFDYPLREEEIAAFLACGISATELESSLRQLADNGIVYRLEEFYSLRNLPPLASRRRRGNERAVRRLKTARRVAAWLSAFPYVRGVAVSGSLSKNYADEAADLDYFIITATNRLWIARTIMHLFKKLSFLAGKEDWFCMNYYVDEAALEIEEKNIYTAVETVTLLAVRGMPAFNRFRERNSWVKKYFPVYPFNDPASGSCQGRVKRMLERAMDIVAGDRFDRFLMEITRKRWERKTAGGRTNAHGIRMAMKVGRHYSKPEPGYFQDEVLLRYEKKLQEASGRLYALSPEYGSLVQGF